MRALALKEVGFISGGGDNTCPAPSPTPTQGPTTTCGSTPGGGGQCTTTNGGTTITTIYNAAGNPVSQTTCTTDTGKASFGGLFRAIFGSGDVSVTSCTTSKFALIIEQPYYG